MTTTTDNLGSTSGDHTVAQTPENTLAPFEANPNIPAPVGQWSDGGKTFEEPPVAPPKKKRIRLTPKQRAEKIAAGWNPPGPRPGYTPQQKEEEPVAIQPSQGDIVLKALVDKLVALENNAQYRSVWLHFFNHGGVFTGPKYVDELHAAIQYLIGIENAKAGVGG